MDTFVTPYVAHGANARSHIYIVNNGNTGNDDDDKFNEYSSDEEDTDLGSDLGLYRTPAIHSNGDSINQGYSFKERLRTWYKEVCCVDYERDGEKSRLQRSPLLIDFCLLTGSLFLIWIIGGLVIGLVYEPHMNPNATRLTPAEQFTVSKLVLAPSILSTIGSIVIILMFFAMKRYRGLHFQMVTFLAVSDLGLVLSFLAVRSFPNSYWVCYFQAACSEYFPMCAVLWTFCIGFSLFEHTVKLRPLRQLQRLAIIFHVLSWGVPAIFALLVLALRMSAPTVAWCWIDTKYTAWRFLFFYLLNFLSFIYIFVFYFVIMIYAAKSYFMVRKLLAQGLSAAKKRTLILSLRLTSYLVVFFLTWIWGLAHRVANLFDPSDIYILIALHTFFTPLQGFLNFLAYSFSYRDVIIAWIKIKISELKHRNNKKKKKQGMNQHPEERGTAGFDGGEAGGEAGEGYFPPTAASVKL